MEQGQISCLFFLVLYTTGKKIDLPLTPEAVAKSCGHLPGRVFLDTSQEAGCSDALSLVAAAPHRVCAGNFFHAGDWQRFHSLLKNHSVDANGDVAPTGAAIGYVGFDGAFYFGFYRHLLVYRHAAQSWYAFGDLLAKLQPNCIFQSTPLFSPPSAPLDFRAGLTRAEFCSMVKRVQEYIAAGDVYQVNLSQRFFAKGTLTDPFAFYQVLRECSPAPMSAYLELGGQAILSSSPELFLKMSGNQILTRPIKGTRPRYANAEADEESASSLLASNKEIAELVMITDLERNDLGQVCRYGTIRVTELLKLERFRQVFHLVSSICGELRPEIDQATAFRKCFPGGSISGAPKKRALEIIQELEPVPRGLYTGAIGYFGFNQESQFNIVIRTVICQKSQTFFHVGAGIVADSQPEMEYEETLHKASGILLAAKMYAEQKAFAE